MSTQVHGHGSEIFDQLRALSLPGHDYAVFGSGPLLVRGIIDAVNDLDVLCRGEVWALVSHLADSRTVENGESVVAIGSISFGTRWGLGTFDEDDLIDSAEIIDGLPFVALEHVVAYKEIARRPKDLAHLEMIAQWRESRMQGR